MFIVFNGLVVLIIVLIAYWWANQGLFSALLHLLCIIIAGVVAFGLWEPITVKFLLGIKGLGDYAWGISLISVFVVTGLILRIVTNKVVGANVQIPRWANLVFGGALGAVAGIFSVGIVMIGAGFLQTATEIMGYEGVVRGNRNAEIPDGSPQPMWVPAHEWTYAALSMLSDTSLSTRTPLSKYNPRIDYMAASLLRDSYRDGKGKLSLAPKDAKLDRFRMTPDRRFATVTMTFSGAARDFGDVLTMSKSQVRLILDDGRAVHPFGWAQRTANAPTANFLFDDKSHYASSVPGADNATITFKFDLASRTDTYGGTAGAVTSLPRFIQVRGTRFSLPQAGNIGANEIGNLSEVSNNSNAAPRPVGGTNISSAIEVATRMQGINISINQITGMDTIQVDDTNYISDGHTEIRTGGTRAGPRLRVSGIYEPAGTRIVQINISRSSPANLFDRSISTQTDVGDLIKLVDTNGQTYTPIGYIHRRPDQTSDIKLDPADGVPTMADIPALPTSGDHQLKLIFRITIGVTIQALTLGDLTIGTCNVLIEVDD